MRIEGLVRCCISSRLAFFATDNWRPYAKQTFFNNAVVAKMSVRFENCRHLGYIVAPNKNHSSCRCFRWVYILATSRRKKKSLENVLSDPGLCPKLYLKLFWVTNCSTLIACSWTCLLLVVRDCTKTYLIICLCVNKLFKMNSIEWKVMILYRNELTSTGCIAKWGASCYRKSGMSV